VLQVKNKNVALAALLLLTSTAFAESNQSGAVKDIVERPSDGAVLVSLTGPLHAKASCSAGSYWVIKDEKTRSGKIQRDALEKARSEKQNVTFIGAGSCSRVSDGEDIDSIVVASLPIDENRNLDVSPAPAGPPPRFVPSASK